MPQYNCHVFLEVPYWGNLSPTSPKRTIVSPITSQHKPKNVAGFRVDRSGEAARQTVKPTPENQSTTDTPVIQPRSSPPLPKRNKGQLFLAFIFLGFFATIFYLVYATFFQYKAYGVVSGRIIQVGAPWDGTVTNWQIRDGELVEQGQVLSVISNIEMEHRLQTLDDELRYAQAKVDAEASKIRFHFSDRSDREQKALAEYLESQGNLLAERTVLSELEQRLKRSTRLQRAGSMSKQAYDELFFKCTGQRLKVEKLEKAVDVLRERSENSDDTKESKSSQLDPLLVKIQQIQSERERLRARIDMGRIVAPVSGRITMRALLTGESIRQGETIVEILEDNSAEATLYVPQTYTDEFKVGAKIMLALEPFETKVPCVVKRIGSQFKPAPGSIERFYQKQQHLLPVYLVPVSDYREEFAMRINGTVKLSYSWGEWVQDIWTTVVQKFQNDGSDTSPKKRSRPKQPINKSTDEDDQIALLHGYPRPIAAGRSDLQ